MNERPSHAHFMTLAYEEAVQAYKEGEVPVGALLVAADGEVIARAHNQVQHLQMATAHAEMLALQCAFKVCQAKYLPTCTLYVTLEPCAMCAAACGWAQLCSVVFAAADTKRGYQRMGGDRLLHPKATVVKGIGADASQALLLRFFRELRKKK